MRSLVLCLAGLLVSRVTSVLPKLPTLGQQQDVASDTGFNERSMDLPSEDIPLDFGSSKPRLDTVAAISAAVSVSVQEVVPEVHDSTEWRPNDLHLITSRRASFTQSQPHLPGGNCHVSRIRAMSHCPHKCSGHGTCGVSESQKGFKYIPSMLPGICQCADGWTQKDCSIESASPITSVLVSSGNSRSETLALPGNVIRVTLISATNINSINVTSFRVGRKLVSTFVVVPDSGVSPCKVWHVAYSVAPEDFGEVTFTMNYFDYKDRIGTVTSEDKLVRGKVLATSFADGARHWRLRALTISKGGHLENLAWRIGKISLFAEPGQKSPIQTDSATKLASSEVPSDCGTFGTCSNATFGGFEYRFSVSMISSDSDAMTSKLINFPRGFGKRIMDTRSKKYVGTGPIRECATACDSMSQCEAFTFGRTGCFLHTRLIPAVSPVFSVTSTYFKVYPKCAPHHILTCNGECLSDPTCRNHTSVRPRPLKCVDLIGRGTCTAEQNSTWNCPLHGCNHNDCETCGKDNFQFGKDLLNGRAEHAFDIYASHYWQSAVNEVGEWIAISFATAQPIRSILVEQPSINNAPWSVVIEQSNDWVNWMPVAIMDDFAALKYATDLPSPAEVAEVSEPATQLTMRFVEFEDVEDQILADLGFSEGGNTLIPTVTFCYYMLDSDPTTDFFNFATYESPTPQIAAKFFVPQNTSHGLRPLPRSGVWKAKDGCVDIPAGWTDKVGRTCDLYSKLQYCTSAGGVGSGWTEATSIKLFGNADGISAFDACCACGGGAKFNRTDSGAEAVVALLELDQPTTADLLNDDLDEFGCPPTASWCPYSMTCVTLVTYDALCRAPPERIRAPTVPATWFVFRDESRIPGVINGSLSIIAAYNDQKDSSISEYALFFSKDDSGSAKSLIGSPLLVLQKGGGILSGVVPNSVIPKEATHLAVMTQNQGLGMAFGITRPLEQQLNIYGDLGAYHSQSCAVWRRNGPNYHDIQGFTVAPMKNFYKGKEMAIKISGSLHCSDVLDAHGTHVGRGKALVHWTLFHSKDGSNSNASPIPKVEYDPATYARGTFEIADGQCTNFADGVPIQGFVPRFQGGYIAVWMRLEWQGPDNGADYALVCDDLTYEIVQGVSVDPEPAAEGEFYCGEQCKNGGSDPVMVLKYRPRSKFSGTCTSDEGRVCVDEWIADGCGNNPPFVFGLSCDDYKSCYAEAMSDGLCGADLADSDCSSDEAVLCIDTWVEKGCPNTPSPSCVQYEECAIQAVLMGRCEGLKVNCSSTEAVACIEGWVAKGCGEYPPVGDGSCDKFETCAAKATEAGRCGVIVDCSVKEARTCVDEWVDRKCPEGHIASVGSTDCTAFDLCFRIAHDAGRCVFPEPTPEPTPQVPGEEIAGEGVTPGDVDATPVAPASPLGDVGQVVGDLGGTLGGVTNGVNGALGGATSSVNSATGGAASTAQQVAGSAGKVATSGAASAASSVNNVGNAAAASLQGAGISANPTQAVSGVTSAVTNPASSVQSASKAAEAVTKNIPNVGGATTQATSAATGVATSASGALRSVLPGMSGLTQIQSTREPPNQWNQRHLTKRRANIRRAAHPSQQAAPHFTSRPGLRHLLRYKGRPSMPVSNLYQHHSTATEHHQSTLHVTPQVHTTPMKQLRPTTNQLPPPPVHNQAAPTPQKAQEDVEPVTTVDWKAINAASRQQWLRFMKSGEGQVESLQPAVAASSVPAVPESREVPEPAADPQPVVDWKQKNQASKQKWLDLLRQPN